MKLTRASSYAFHALTYLAGQDQAHPVASHIIAEAQDIPERFLLKVLKPLVSKRILNSIKGPNGGYRLARGTREITMLEVIEAVDGEIRGQAPLIQDGKTTHVDVRLEQVCHTSAEHTRKCLEKVRIQDLLPSKRASRE